MAMSISTLQGMKDYRKVAEGEQLLLPGDPGVTYARNSMLGASNGVLINGTDSLAPPHVVCPRGIVCPANTQPFPVVSGQGGILGARHKYAAEDLTLVPVATGVPSGTQVYLGKINGHGDQDVVTYTASTRKIAGITGFGTDDYANGALVYVYEGPGAGELNVVEDYVHSGTELQMHRKFSATLTSDSKIIVLCDGAGSANNPVGPIFGRMDLQDVDELEVDDGSDDGNFHIYGDWFELNHYIAKGWVPFVKMAASGIYE